MLDATDNNNNWMDEKTVNYSPQLSLKLDYFCITYTHTRHDGV